jgi:hypothetical protein
VLAYAASGPECSRTPRVVRSARVRREWSGVPAYAASGPECSRTPRVVRSARGAGYGKRLEKKVDKSDFILLTQYGFYEMIKDPSKILLCKKCVAAMTFLRPPRKSCGQAARKKSSGRKKSQGGPTSPEKSRYIFGDLSIFWAIFRGGYLKIVDTFCRCGVIIAVESDVKLFKKWRQL